WERVFAGTFGGRPLTRVVVTHFHPDHMGNAGWLAERWRARLWCTQAEWLYAQWAWLARDATGVERRLAHYRRHGCGEEAPAALARPALPRPPRAPGPAPRPPRGAAGRGDRRARRAAERRPARPRPVPPRARHPSARLRARRDARAPALPRGGGPRRTPGRRR